MDGAVIALSYYRGGILQAPAVGIGPFASGASMLRVRNYPTQVRSIWALSCLAAAPRNVRLRRRTNVGSRRCCISGSQVQRIHTSRPLRRRRQRRRGRPEAVGRPVVRYSPKRPFRPVEATERSQFPSCPFASKFGQGTSTNSLMRANRPDGGCTFAPFCENTHLVCCACAGASKLKCRS